MLKNQIKKAVKNEEKKPAAKPKNQLWFSVSESARIGGVQTKTIRRAIKSKGVKFKVSGNRYLISFESLLIFLHKNTKLKNKLANSGIGQFVKEWR